MAGLKLEIIEPQENEEPATDKQMSFIRALCAEVGASFPADALKDLGKWQASALIEQLLEFKAELAGDEPLDKSRLSGIDWDAPLDDSDSDSASTRSSSSTGSSGDWKSNPWTITLVIVGGIVLLYLMVK